MAFHVYAGADGTRRVVDIRRIDNGDVLDALRLGFSDFWAKPSHYVFLCLIYPLVGVMLMAATSGENAFHLLFPLMAGFALLGPLAAIGLYEISRRRERGLDASWHHVRDILSSPAVPSILAIGALLVVLFLCWLYAAELLYQSLYGPVPPAGLAAFLADVFTTERGWMLIVFGNLIGLVFALVVLTTTVVAFPLLLDRDVGAYAAVETSARAVLANPVPMLFWGLIVAICLAVGSIPLFAGLAVVVPILGHATWHLYRKVVAPPAGGQW